MFIIGPKASGKSKIAEDMAARSNMNHINFSEFIDQNGLKGKDDETVTHELIQALSKEMYPRVIIENFP
jgi:cytidylate kinase